MKKNIVVIFLILCTLLITGCENNQDFMETSKADYYSFGDPKDEANRFTSYGDVTYDGKIKASVFVSIINDELSVCSTKMSTDDNPICFKINDYDKQSKKLKKACKIVKGDFKNNNLNYKDIKIVAVSCDNGKYSCSMHAGGFVGCHDYVNGYYCEIESNGKITCE